MNIKLYGKLFYELDGKFAIWSKIQRWFEQHKNEKKQNKWNASYSESRKQASDEHWLDITDLQPWVN